MAPPTQHFLLDLKQQILSALGKLGDRDTQGTASRELEHIALNMPFEAIPIFLSALYDTDKNQKSSARKECVRMFGVLATYHGDLLIPHLPKIVGSIVNRFKDADSGVNEACANSLGVIAANVGGEQENSDGHAYQSVLIVFLKPLLDALNEQSRNIQMAASMCIEQVLQNSREPLDYIAHRLAVRLVKCLGKPTFLGKPQLLKAIGTLFEVTGNALIDHLPVLVPILQEMLASSDWITRKASAESLIDMISNVGSVALAHYREGVLTALENCRLDKTKPVREVATKAIILWEDIPSPRAIAEGSGMDGPQDGSQTPDRFSPFSSYWHSFVNRDKEKSEVQTPQSNGKPGISPAKEEFLAESTGKHQSPASADKLRKSGGSERLSFGEFRKQNPLFFEQAKNSGLEKGEWQIEIAVPGDEKPHVVVLKENEAGETKGGTRASEERRRNSHGEGKLVNGALSQREVPERSEEKHEELEEAKAVERKAGLKEKSAELFEEEKEDRLDSNLHMDPSTSELREGLSRVQEVGKSPRRKMTTENYSGNRERIEEGEYESDSGKSFTEGKKGYKEIHSAASDSRFLVKSGGSGAPRTHWRPSGSSRKSGGTAGKLRGLVDSRRSPEMGQSSELKILGRGSHGSEESSRRPGRSSPSGKRSEEGRTEWNFDREEVLRSIKKAHRRQNRAYLHSSGSEERYGSEGEEQWNENWQRESFGRIRDQLARIEEQQAKQWAGIQSLLASTQHAVEGMELRLRGLERLVEINSQDNARWRFRMDPMVPVGAAHPGNQMRFGGFEGDGRNFYPNVYQGSGISQVPGLSPEGVWSQNQNSPYFQNPQTQSPMYFVPSTSQTANQGSPSQQRVYMAMDMPQGVPVQVAPLQAATSSHPTGHMVGHQTNEVLPAQHQPFRNISRKASLNKEDVASLDNVGFEGETPSGVLSRSDSLRGQAEDQGSVLGDPSPQPEALVPNVPSAVSVGSGSNQTPTFKPPRSPSAAHFSRKEKTPLSALSQGSEKKSTQKDRALWNTALEHLKKGDLTEAYKLAVQSGDGGLLVRLMGRTGPVLGELEGMIRREVLGMLLTMVEQNEHMDYILPWMRQLAELEDEKAPDFQGLNIPREIQLRTVAVLRAYSDGNSASGWIGAMSGQLASQLSASWRV